MFLINGAKLSKINEYQKQMTVSETCFRKFYNIL